MVTEIWVYTGSGHGLVLWTNVDCSSVKSSDIHIRTISQEMPQPSITKICLKIKYLKFHSNSPGANELNDFSSPKWWYRITDNRRKFIKNLSNFTVSTVFADGLAPSGAKTFIDKTKTHDNVIKWKHFPRDWPFVRGIHRSPVNSPHKGQWCRALMFSLMCARINHWVKNGEAGDLRHNRAHYDVIVMHIQDPKLHQYWHNDTPWVCQSPPHIQDYSHVNMRHSDTVS